MLKNLNMRSKLLLMLAAPLAGLLIFSVLEIKRSYQVLDNVSRVTALTGVAVRIGALTHEIQKERGLSAGFLNAKGEKFRQELAAQRERVNSEAVKVKEYLTRNRPLLGEVKNALDHSAVRQEKLQQIRARIDQQSVAGPQSYSFFTDLIGSYLDVVATVATLSRSHEVMRVATAYYGFVRAKEETGKERGTLNAVLAEGKFDQEKYRRTLQIVAAHAAYLNLFRKFATAEEVAALDQKSQAPVFREVEDMTEGILAKGMAGGFALSPETWYGTVTKKMEVLKEMEDLLVQDILKASADLAAQARSALVYSVAFSLALVIIALGVGFLVFAGITAPLSRMLQMLKDIAEGEGDLTRRMQVDRRDEIGEVSLWFNRFVDNVHDIVSRVAGNSVQISNAAGHLTSTAEQIATAAEEVACQSGTVATAGEEMSATSNDISRSCARAAEVSNRAGATAKEGALVVQQTLVGMQNIARSVQQSASTVAALGERSDQIGAIVGTIGEIADQTNLLSLNAAIEAARAGEQGRGFAVVADEVRALADRTTRATREIGEMIKSIQRETSGAVSSMENGVREVEKGMASSEQSGAALDVILRAIDEVTAQVHQIATAAEEQTAVTGEISSNIHQINGVVSETARGAHETASAAAQLLTLANHLQGMVERFKLA